MRILTYDELTPTMEVDRTLLQLAAFAGVFPRSSVDVYRKRTRSFSEYVALFAVEHGHAVGQMFVLRIPYTFPGGTETVSGIAGVATRPDRAGAGIARTLLTEVHRREKEAGIRFSTLWTNRSWGAHRLYEKLGYRDVYSYPWAVHGPVARLPNRPPGIRKGRRSDLAEVERVHAEQAKGRLGFVRAPDGYTAAAVAAGDLHPEKELIVLRSGGRLRGYAQFNSDPQRLTCGELVATSAGARRALVAGVIRTAGRRAFAFQHTAVSDHPELFRGNGYSFSPSAWWALMACALGRHWTPGAAVSQFATRDPRFLCLGGDRF